MKLLQWSVINRKLKIRSQIFFITKSYFVVKTIFEMNEKFKKKIKSLVFGIKIRVSNASGFYLRAMVSPVNY